MRLSSLCTAAVLLLSVLTFAQHSSGGGGSSSSGSSGGSSGGGGGSHGGGGGSSSSGGSGGGHSSGGSGSSSSAHSSGGSSSHGSSGHGSSAHSSIATPTSTHPGVNNSRPVSNAHTNHERSIREPNTNARARTEMPQKRSFFGFLRHPFRKPEPKPKPVTDLRRPVCLRGPCSVCPPGQVHAGGCGGAFYIRHQHTHCTSGEIWNGGACLFQTQFLDSCNSLRMTMQRQQQRMQAAESARQSACAAGSSQICMDSMSSAQSETALYRTLQERYQRCMQRSVSYPFAGLAGAGYGGYSAGRLFEPFELQFNYP